MKQFLVDHAGHLAGVATSILWTGTSLFFTAASRRLGPVVVNAYRIVLAVVLLGVTHRVLAGRFVPDVDPWQALYLGASGIVGLSIGDQALLTAFMDIGPRLATLIMTTAPLFAVLLGWAALGETLPPIAWIGVATTVSGVAWVVGERTAAPAVGTSGHRARGVLMALVGAICQAGGLLLSKRGMGHGWLPDAAHLDPQAATLVRMVFASLGVLPILALHGYRTRARRALGVVAPRSGSRAAGFAFASAGAFVGPFLGVWMSLIASDRAPLGVAQTLCSLTPIFLVPLSAWLYGERVGPRAALGAVLAVGGTALLFARD